MDSGSPLGTRLHFHTAPFYLARFIYLQRPLRSFEVSQLAGSMDENRTLTLGFYLSIYP